MADRYFVWDPAKLELKLPALDKEHQVLIQLMNELHESVEKKETKQRQSDRLNALYKATVAHFSGEEKFMQSIAYPDFDRHCLVHKNLLERLQKFATEFTSGKTELGDDFFNFLKVWLASHIAVIDMKYSNHSHSLQKRAS